MMKQLILICAIAGSLCVTAVESSIDSGTKESKLDAEERSRKAQEVYERKFGGFVVQPGSLAGKIGFINGQTELSKDEILKVVAAIKHGMAYNIEVLDMAVPTPMPSSKDVSDKGVDAAVYVVSNDSLPTLLVSPEENWALVNVKKCKVGLSDDVLGKRLFALRCRGELMRGFAQACGIWTSNYTDNILNARSPQELDTMKVDSLVADMLQRCKAHLARIGVTQERKVMYTRACHEGWAPAPTNEFQKAIWEKVHAMPTEPLKIKPETKKQEK